MNRRSTSTFRLTASAAAFAAGSLVSLQAHASIIYETDFESGAGAEWSSSSVSSAGVFTSFAGRYGNSALTLGLGTNAGADYTVTFDLYLFDSWDGDHKSWGSDRFGVMIDGQTIFQESFSNFLDRPDWAPSYAGLPDEGGSNLAFSSWDDSIYRNMQFSFSAAGDATEVSFFATGLQGLNDESWGLDNVVVQTVPSPAPMGVVGAGALALAGCGRRRRG